MLFINFVTLVLSLSLYLQYEVVWNTDKKNHSKTWEDTKLVSIMSWLYPRGQLKKKYNGHMHQDHKNDLENANWDLKKVKKHLKALKITEI